MNTYPRVYLTYHADGEVGIGTPKDASAPLGEPVEHLRVSHTSKGRQMNRSLRQAAQQALEAMLAFPDDISDEMFEAIRALKERLAQPEQEPVAFRNKETGEFCTGGFMQKEWSRWTPLYSAPPKRELTCVCGAVMPGVIISFD